METVGGGVLFPSKAERGNVRNLFYVDSHHDGISFSQFDLGDSSTMENLFHHSVHTLSLEIRLGQLDNLDMDLGRGMGVVSVYL